MSLMNTTKTAIAKLAEYDIKQHASLLKWTTLIIWTCSLIAEVGTFYFNKKLPPKEKQFIIKQELTAGGISLLVTYLLADRAEKIGNRLVETGRLLPRELPSQLRKPEVLKTLLTEKADNIKGLLERDKAWATKLLQFRKGVSVVTGTLGTIIGFNLVTPLVSNKIASYFHNKALEKKPEIAPQEQVYKGAIGKYPQQPIKPISPFLPTASYLNTYSNVLSR